MHTKDNAVRMQNLFIAGTILTFAGLLLEYGCPISKKIWSPTFALTTCGLAASALALLIWIIDIKATKGGAASSKPSASTPCSCMCWAAC